MEGPAIVSAMDYLKCPACKYTAASPIYSCEIGHILCGICHEKIKTCQVCQKTVALNGLAERILEGVVLPCRNLDLGCPSMIKSSDMKGHLETCEFGLIQCLETKTTFCQKKFYSPKKLFDHWKSVHKILTLSKKLQASDHKFIVGPSYPDFPKAKLGRDTQWPTGYFKIDSFTFFGNLECVDGIIYTWITLLGTEAEANQYKFDASVCYGNGIKMKSTGLGVHCMPFCKLAKVKETGDFAIASVLPLKQLPEAQTYNGKPGWVFHVEWRVYKTLIPSGFQDSGDKIIK